MTKITERRKIDEKNSHEIDSKNELFRCACVVKK